MSVICIPVISFAMVAALTQGVPNQYEWRGLVTLNVQSGSRMALLTIDQSQPPDGKIEFSVLFEFSDKPIASGFSVRGRVNAHRDRGFTITTEDSLIFFATVADMERSAGTKSTQLHRIVGSRVIKYLQPPTNDTAKELLKRYDQLPRRARRGL